ncbi:ribonuclease P protein component [Mesonia sp. K7]|uniref:ribonuclease P protein component n=1 Tax=Mesonia sp. K7 TaxID=2218606 RepID=UPI000DAA4750|nr:ribonuclease P protein component [Mesonia sp. K7]PZD79149.1 ribonuclease P protein component [Mesonia sp. K7]
MRQSFPKIEKLTNQKVIEQLFEEGKSLKKFPIKLLYVPIENKDTHLPKVAFSVPKRAFKLAVTRNKLKRRLREVYRKNKAEMLPNHQNYAIMFIYLGNKVFAYAEIEKAMLDLLTIFIEKEKS